MKGRSLLSSQTLVNLGLSSHEAKVYQVLYEERSLSAKEIAKRVGVLPNAVYRLLNKLIKKELASTSDQHPKIYRAIPPSIALDSFVKKKILTIETLKEKAVKELTKKGAKTPETEINLIPGRYEIMMAYVQMAKGTKKEILIISIGEPVPEEVILAHRDAIKEGIKIRMIAHKFGEENQKLLKSWQKMGLEIRHFLDWGFHLVVFDGQKSILAINNPQETQERIGMQIFSRGLSKALRDYFYSVWEKAIKI